MVRARATPESVLALLAASAESVGGPRSDNRAAAFQGALKRDSSRGPKLVVQFPARVEEDWRICPLDHSEKVKE